MKTTGERKIVPLHEIYRDRLSAPVESIPSVDLATWLDLYRVMATSRRGDELEAELARRGEAAFHLTGTGHEAVAALQSFLSPQDWLHLHYRDKALLLARGVAPEVFFHNLLGTAASTSAGRQIPPFVDSPALQVLSPNVPVGNNALAAVGVAREVKDRPGSPIVVCSVGDGTTQQGEVLEAIAEAVRAELPVLFLVEDNRYAISTTTSGRTFFSLPEWCGGPPDSFLGLPIHRLDGRDVVRLHGDLGPIVRSVRDLRRPALAVLAVERLDSHSNADDQRVYRSQGELDLAQQAGDPVAVLRARLLASGVTPADLDRIDAEVEADLQRAAEKALATPDPSAEPAAKAPLPDRLTRPEVEYLGHDRQEGARLTMLEAIRDVLRFRLGSDPRVTLFGEDIEDPKGDVFGVTRGLSSAFPGRVLNSPLSESTIVGVSVGRALAGGRPVGFIQFADFLPLAYNQIFCELGSMHWRSAGAWSCPVILMVACGGYRPGLGPFHAETLESLMARVPGLDVLMPSSAADAAGLLNAAFESGRPTVFLYPKSCLNDRDRTTSGDVERQLVPIGRARFLRRGDDLTLVVWGSTVQHGLQAADALAEAGCGVDLIDLRSLSPWDEAAVRESARRTGRLLVVHEDARACGLGAEVLATLAEALGSAGRCRRVTRPDTYVPSHYANQLDILPSFRNVLEAAAALLDLDLTWTAPSRPRSDRWIIEARGSSPADQQVTVIAWHVRPGQAVRAGERIAEMEADKSVFELVAPAAGVVEALLAEEGQPVRTGTPLLAFAPEASNALRRRVACESPGVPRLIRKSTPRPATAERRSSLVGVSIPATALATRRVSNEEIAARFPGRSADDILKRTGIQSRRRLADDESALRLGVEAARSALEREGLGLDRIDALICCTGSTEIMTPSMACLILNALGEAGRPREIPAYDLSAACTGYLYALAAAHDLTLAQPDARVLIVSTEALSPLADPDDFDTAILFGDAATATILHGPDAEGGDHAWGRLHRPVVSAKGEPGKVLVVPHPGQGFVRMDGLRVYAEAVRQMVAMLDRACEAAGLSRDDLDLVVPHQANARIITDVRKRMGLPPERVHVNIEHLGNTSSSTIPLCLADLASSHPATRLGLTAFGGGYTFGAAILERTDQNRWSGTSGAAAGPG